MLWGLLAKIEYDGKLSIEAWIILAVMIGLIVGGLSWCLYRAVSAANVTEEEQLPDDV